MPPTYKVLEQAVHREEKQQTVPDPDNHRKYLKQFSIELLESDLNPGLLPDEPRVG